MAIIEVKTLKQLLELTNEKENTSMRKEIIGEAIVRKYIRRKIKTMLHEHKKQQFLQEHRLRRIINHLLTEGDISDMHPHRSTGINVLEDVLKKMITTLRMDYKRMTTSKVQRDSFRAHMISAVKKSLAPSLVNDTYLSGTNTLLSEPPTPFGSSDQEAYGQDSDEFEQDTTDTEIEISDDDELEDALSKLDEAAIEVDVEEDEDKKIPVEDDDQPDEIEAFSDELSDMDETGRNMAFTCFKKISQYILDAYDMLADLEDKKIFVDYLITNMKLYFDKFEDELQKEVEEPTTDQYDSMTST